MGDPFFVARSLARPGPASIALDGLAESRTDGFVAQGSKLKPKRRVSKIAEAVSQDAENDETAAKADKPLVYSLPNVKVMRVNSQTLRVVSLGTIQDETEKEKAEDPASV